MKGLTYFSTFTGIGGLDMGLEKLGAKCVGFSEIKNGSIDIYMRHYPTHQNFGDITKIDFKELPDFNVLTGGFPCQSFSLAGSRKGFKDRRGQMIFYLHDLMVAKKPDLVVLENVKGILNHNGGRTFESVVRLMREAGYHVRVLLLNAINYGSAQNRERVVFIMTKKKLPEKHPIVVDNTKRFRDIRETDGNFKEIPRSDFNYRKIEQLRRFTFELIGGYDRVGTLTTQNGCGEKAVEYGDWYRYLTPLECERLQCFPEGWTAGVKDTHRYFALGNAVNCAMSEYLFTDYLKDYLSGIR